MNTNPTTVNISYSAELCRKGLHLFSLLIPLSAWYLERIDTVVILLWMAIGSMLVDILRFQKGPIGIIFRSALFFILRPHESVGRLGIDKLTGSTWMLMAGVLTFAFFPKEVAVAAFAMLIVGDAAAALIGRKFGRHLMGRGNKTVEGSAAFFFTAFLISCAVPGLPWHVAIAGAIVATLVEVYITGIDDNFTIPILASFAMAILL